MSRAMRAMSRALPQLLRFTRNSGGAADCRVWHVLGIPVRRNLSRYIIEIFPHVHWNH